MTPRFHDSFSILLVFKFSSFLFLGNLISSKKQENIKEMRMKMHYSSLNLHLFNRKWKKNLNETSVESSFEENIIFSS